MGGGYHRSKKLTVLITSKSVFSLLYHARIEFRSNYVKAEDEGNQNVWKTSAWHQHDIKMTSTWRQHDGNMTSTGCQHDVIMTPTWHQHDINMTSTWHLHDINTTWHPHNISHSLSDFSSARTVSRIPGHTPGRCHKSNGLVFRKRNHQQTERRTVGVFATETVTRGFNDETSPDFFKRRSRKTD